MTKNVLRSKIEIVREYNVSNYNNESRKKITILRSFFFFFFVRQIEYYTSTSRVVRINVSVCVCVLVCSYKAVSRNTRPNSKGDSCKSSCRYISFCPFSSFSASCWSRRRNPSAWASRTRTDCRLQGRSLPPRHRDTTTAA